MCVEKKHCRPRNNITNMWVLLSLKVCAAYMVKLLNVTPIKTYIIDITTSMIFARLELIE